MHIGIDLGTTNSVAAFVKDEVPVCLPSAEGEHLVPSVVSFTADGPQWVGQIARRQAVGPRGPDITTITSIKRRMGSAEKVPTAAGDYSPQEISALILGKIKRDAESFLGEPVDGAVITVPAHFNDAQRRATRDAGTIAGLDVLRVINEPTAAALAYGLDQSDMQTVVVWDLGGGTFDVSALDLGEEMFLVRAVAGDTHLGGDDWDGRLVDFLVEEIARRTGEAVDGSPRAVRRLAEAAEDVKKRLSASSSASFRLPADLYDRERFGEISICMRHFQELTSDLGERLLGPTRQAMQDADLDPLEVDRVLLVGGATRMPMVRTLARQFFGREVFHSVDPDRVVALGAAVQAAVLSGRSRQVTLLDVTPLTLGIETLGGVYSPIVARNSSIPITESCIATNARDNQVSMDIQVFQGERAMALHNQHLGTLTLEELVPLPRGEGRYEVVFHVDADGILQVQATELHTGTSAEVQVESAHILSSEQIRAMVADAAAYRDADLADADAARSAIRADSMLRAAEAVLDELEIGDPDREMGELGQILETMDLLRDALARDNKARIDTFTKDLEHCIREVKSHRSCDARAAGR